MVDNFLYELYNCFTYLGHDMVINYLTIYPDKKGKNFAEIKRHVNSKAPFTKMSVDTFYNIVNYMKKTYGVMHLQGFLSDAYKALKNKSKRPNVRRELLRLMANKASDNMKGNSTEYM